MFSGEVIIIIIKSTYTEVRATLKIGSKREERGKKKERILVLEKIEDGRSVTRWLDYFSNIWPFTTMMFCPII